MQYSKSIFEQIVLTTIGLGQVQEALVVVGCVLHNFLDLFFAQYTIFDSIVGLDNYDSNRTDAKKISYL